MSNAAKLIISIVITVGVGLQGSVFAVRGMHTWFLYLNKPAWNPPNWLFAVVWTTLYLLMGIAFYLVWTTKAVTDTKRWAIIIFIAQFALNFLWSYSFFSEHGIAWAFVVMVVWWLAIFCTIIAFSRINITAAWLLVPCIGWVSFAAILNYAIWEMNM